jgi:hypothetical protein
MPRTEQVTIPVADLPLDDPAGRSVRLSDLPGVRVVVLMRHRH